MSHQNFDPLDITILKLLSVNARKPYLEIARECGVSGAAIHQRIQRLTANGVIQGSECLISPAAIGYETCAYVGMCQRDPAKFNEVIEELHKIPEVVECHVTTGQYDILVKLYAHSNDHLFDIIQNKIQAIGLARTETLVSFREVFKRQMHIDLND